MNTTKKIETNKYIKTLKNGAIYFDPTCDDTDIKIDHLKDHFNRNEKEYFFSKVD